MSRTIASVMLITVAAGLLVPSWSSQAAILELRTGVTQATTIWQTYPPAFRDARWVDLGLALLFKRISISLSSTVVDFETMRPESPPAFDLALFLSGPRVWGIMLSPGVGAVLNPTRNWMAWYVELDMIKELAWNVAAFVGVGVETTQGTRGSFFSPGSPAGTCIYLNIGLSWSLSLL